MRMVRMTHPDGLATEVPETAVAQNTLGGWQVDESEAPVPCPACGQPLPGKPPDRSATATAPAESGASSSPAQGRRGSKGDKS